MHIERLHLKNFRGFEEYSLDLEYPITLLVGDNGRGKTSLIDAVTILLSDLLLPFDNEMQKAADELEGSRAVGSNRSRAGHQARASSHRGCARPAPHAPRGVGMRCFALRKEISFQ